MDVIIVCHTEFGLVRNKKVIASKEAKFGVSEGVNNLIEIAEKYNAKVTFAIMPGVVDYFPKNINHEIALHIHPGWQKFEIQGIEYYVGDEYLRKNCSQSSDSTVLRDYPYHEQLDMINTGKEYLTNIFGIEPKSFVAGKWSINDDTVKALIKAGITHECSAPAHSKPCHYDWSRLPRICMPYHPSKEDYQNKGNLPLLIIPISQTLKGWSINPEVVPIIGLSWLKACFSEYYRQNLPLFHICLHSPCMTDLYFTSAMENYLNFISNHENINFKFACEISEYDNVASKTDIFPYLFAVNVNIVRTFLKLRVFCRK